MGIKGEWWRGLVAVGATSEVVEANEFPSATGGGDELKDIAAAQSGAIDSRAEDVAVRVNDYSPLRYRAVVCQGEGVQQSLLPVPGGGGRDLEDYAAVSADITSGNGFAAAVSSAVQVAGRVEGHAAVGDATSRSLEPVEQTECPATGGRRQAKYIAA